MGTIGLHCELRFGCREILDEQALLTCMVYVDWNQIKAAMAATLEDSRTSAIAARLAGAQGASVAGGISQFARRRWLRLVAGTSRGVANGRLGGSADCGGTNGTGVGPVGAGATLEDPRAGPDRWTAAVDNFDEWFGRAVGSIDRLRELFNRSGDRWVKGMRNCRATFG
ncbi:MAG: hypothetical protein J5I93_28405 [Pirellulaceae bacterium]|nr:hypothetical protein [Pirellulaceae bacterium]